MKDLRIKKRNIDIAYNKAIENLISDIKKEFIKLCCEGKGAENNLIYNQTEDEVYYKVSPISSLSLESIWEIYINIFNKTVLRK